MIKNTGSISACSPTKDTYKVHVPDRTGSIGACSPTKDTYKVHVPIAPAFSIGACRPPETQQLNEDLTDIDIEMGYVFDDASSYKVSDVPTQLLRWFVEKNGNKKLQQCYHVFNPDSFDYEVIWKDIEMVYEE